MIKEESHNPYAAPQAREPVIPAAQHMTKARAALYIGAAMVAGIVVACCGGRGWLGSPPGYVAIVILGGFLVCAATVCGRKYQLRSLLYVMSAMNAAAWVSLLATVAVGDEMGFTPFSVSDQDLGIFAGVTLAGSAVTTLLAWVFSPGKGLEAPSCVSRDSSQTADT